MAGHAAGSLRSFEVLENRALKMVMLEPCYGELSLALKVQSYAFTFRKLFSTFTPSSFSTEYFVS